MTTHSICGWTFGDADSLDWQHPFGPGLASKQLASANGQTMMLFKKMDPGVSIPEHDHGGPEFSYLIEGDLASNGVAMAAGHAYGAEVGTTHTEFTTEGGALFVTVLGVPS